MIWSVIREYGLSWTLCRGLYSTKLTLLRRLPAFEGLFEKRVKVERIDIFDDNTEEIETFIKALPQELCDELIETADKAARGIIKGFSSVELDYGNPINWQMNPLTQKQCNKNDKWFRISDFDAERGDIKAVWEISRFSHFITLARAYLLTGDVKYSKAFSEQLAWWLEENPYSFGANYKCGQESALRMMNVLLAYSVFASRGAASREDYENVVELVERCYRKILSNFFYAFRCIKNNHTISELVGMIIGAWCCNDEKRLRKSYKLLDKVIDEQFMSDGGYKQFSFNYQRLALQDLEYLISLSHKTGLELSEGSLKKIKNSVSLLYQCLDETGDVANYGANDGALIFPLTSCTYRDFRPIVCSLYAMLFNVIPFSEGIYDEEHLWFHNGVPPNEIPRNAIPRNPTAFADAGLFTLRAESSWAMLVLNNYRSRPQHMDQQHFDLWINGVNALCDGGTYSYADKKGEGLILTAATIR